MSFLIFGAAAVLSLPRQLAPVVIGWMAASSDGTLSKKAVEWVVIALTIIVTIIAMRYINTRVDAAKPLFVRQRQKARQAHWQASPSVSPQILQSAVAPFTAAGPAEQGALSHANGSYDQLAAPQAQRPPPVMVA
jgi:hypothetical protein